MFILAVVISVLFPEEQKSVKEIYLQYSFIRDNDSLIQPS